MDNKKKITSLPTPCSSCTLFNLFIALLQCMKRKQVKHIHLIVTNITPYLTLEKNIHIKCCMKSSNYMNYTRSYSLLKASQRALLTCIPFKDFQANRNAT